MIGAFSLLAPKFWTTVKEVVSATPASVMQVSVAVSTHLNESVHSKIALPNK